MNCILNEFMQDGKKPEIKHNFDKRLWRQREKDYDIDAKIHAIRISWIKQLLNTDFHSWKQIPKHVCRNLGHLTISPSNLRYCKAHAPVMETYGLSYFGTTVLSWYHIQQPITMKC